MDLSAIDEEDYLDEGETGKNNDLVEEVEEKTGGRLGPWPQKAQVIAPAQNTYQKPTKRDSRRGGY